MRNWLALIFALFFGCILNSCATSRALEYPEPELDKPFVFIIDAFKMNGSFEDYVKLHNEPPRSKLRGILNVTLVRTEARSIGSLLYRLV